MEQKSIDLENMIDPHIVDAKLRGDVGTELPKYNRNFYPGYSFYVEGGSLYTLMPNKTDIDVFEGCIEVKKGNYKWVQVVYNAEDKSRIQGNVIEHDELHEYPDGILEDTNDVLNNLYLKLDLSNESKLLVKNLIKDELNKEEIEKLTESKFVENFKLNKQLVIDAIPHILFKKWIE